MKKLICLLMIAVGITAHAQNPYKKFTQNLPFKMSEVKAPVIPNRQVNLRDFGAVNDGVTLNTQAFAKAIDAHSIISIRHMNHFIRLGLNAFISLNDTRSRNTGISNAGRPKHRFTKKWAE